MIDQGLRHLVERAEQVRVDFAVHLGDRVFHVDAIERDIAVVRIDDDFHAVADVVQSGDARGVGVQVGLRIRVLDPEEPAIHRHEVRIRVQQQKRRDGLYTFTDVAPVEDAAFVGDCVADQHVVVTELPGVRQAPDQGVELHATGSLVDRRLVAVLADREIELLLVGVDNDEVGRYLAVVDARLFDIDDANRRDVPDEVFGQAAIGHLVHRHHGEPKAVGELQARVYPTLLVGWQARLVQLSGAEHDLADLAIDHVAIDVHMQEVIERRKRLELVQHLPERAVVPEADVLYRLRVGGDLRFGDARNARREAAFFDLVQAIGSAGGLDVALDELSLLGQLVWIDRELLDRGRIDEATDDGAGDPEAHRTHRQHEEPAPEETDHDRDAHQGRQPHQQVNHGKLGVDIRVGGAERCASV